MFSKLRIKLQDEYLDSHFRPPRAILHLCHLVSYPKKVLIPQNLPHSAMAASDESPTATSKPEPELQHKWSFYLHYPTYTLTKNYSDQAYEWLCDFHTVAGFWNIMEHIPKPSEVFMNHGVRAKVNGRSLEAIGLFKWGLKPEWEDPINLKGGHFECRSNFDMETLDMMWYKLQLALVGETLENGRDLVGARVVDKCKSQKTEYRLEVWVATPSTSDEIHQNLVNLFHEIIPGMHFVWKSHSESMTNALWCNASKLGIDRNKL